MDARTALECSTGWRSWALYSDVSARALVLTWGVTCIRAATSGLPGSTGRSYPRVRSAYRFRDASWVYGDGAFDMTRSFNHRLFKVKEHVDRLYRSLKYLRIDPGFGPQKMCALTEELFERNRHLLGPDDDYWVGQRISRGVKQTPGDNIDYHGPNVVLECSPLPLVQRAKLFKEGIRLVIPSHRRVPPDALTPRAKTHNYLNLIVANQEVQSIDPEAWALLLDVNGNLCEGLGSNIFTVREGEILTPREKFVLPGVSRQTVIDLARQEGLPLRETDIDLYDAYNAEEIFLTSTSLCICPVTRINGVEIGSKTQVWGRDQTACRRLSPLGRSSILWVNTSSATWRACKRARFEVNRSRFRRPDAVQARCVKGQERQPQPTGGAAMQAAACCAPRWPSVV